MGDPISRGLLKPEAIRRLSVARRQRALAHDIANGIPSLSEPPSPPSVKPLPRSVQEDLARALDRAIGARRGASEIRSRILRETARLLEDARKFSSGPALTSRERKIRERRIQRARLAAQAVAREVGALGIDAAAVAAADLQGALDRAEQPMTPRRRRAVAQFAMVYAVGFLWKRAGLRLECGSADGGAWPEFVAHASRAAGFGSGLAYARRIPRLHRS